MALKRMLTASGAPALAVDTRLSTWRIQPGGRLAGTVRLWDGSADADIEDLAVLLLIGDQQRSQPDNSEAATLVELHRARVHGPFTLYRREEITFGFEFTVPWETPVNVIVGRRLPDLALGVCTGISTATVTEWGHLDHIAVDPLPSQMRILQALLRLGCQLKAAGLTQDRLEGADQGLPFHQQITFYPPVQHSGIAGDVRVSWVADAHHLHLRLDAARRSGRAFSDAAVARFHVSHADALHADWPSEFDRWLTLLPMRPSAHRSRDRPDAHR